MRQRVLDELVPQVKRNCLVSDAGHWGYHSICGLLLRLRGLYRSEHGLMPWDEIDEQDILRWIGETEEQWEANAGDDLSQLRIDGMSFDAFDLEGINALLAGLGLLYGAGYGMFMKPVFFLADLESREEAGGCMVLRAGREHARDLSTHPAMLQDGTILARAEVARSLIWERFEEMRARKHPGLVSEAFGAYGITRDSGPDEVEAVAMEELNSYIYHEVGESLEGERLSPLWLRMLSSCRGNKSSAFLRATKDTLADTSPGGMLWHIIEKQKTGSLLFYAAMLQGYRAGLSINVKDACLEFMETGDWALVDSARESCYRDTCKTAAELLESFESGGDSLEADVEMKVRMLQY